MAALLSVADALARVLDGVEPLPSENAPLTDADGRVLAADVAALADHLGVDRFAVQGLSAGGPYALAVAALLGDRVAACAAVCSHWPCRAVDMAPRLSVQAARRSWSRAVSAACRSSCDCRTAGTARHSGKKMRRTSRTSIRPTAFVTFR